MVRLLTIALLFFMSLYAIDIMPQQTIDTNGEVIDLVVKNQKIYATTDSGKVDIFDLKTKKLIKEIKFKKIKDIFGDMNDVRVFSVDILDGKMIVASQGTKGFSRVYLYYDTNYLTKKTKWL